MTRQNFAIFTVLLLSILIPLGLQAQTQLPAPTELTATVQNKTVRLEWQEVEGAARYRVAIHTKATAWQYMDKQSVRNYTHTDLADGILYQYSVQAIDADGVRGQWSGLVSAILGITLPSVPNVTVGIEEGAITVRWDPASGADSYQIRSWWEGLAAWKTLDANLTTTEFVHTDTTEGVEYYYIVRAVNQAGRSNWSSYLSETAPADSGAQGPTATPVPPTTTPTATATPASAVITEPTVEPTVTPLPVEGDEPCTVVEPLGLFTQKLQPRTLTAFVNNYGEAPVARETDTIWFVPETGLLEVGYVIRKSDAQYVRIWEFWRGCQFNGGEMYLSDYKGNRLD